MLWRISPSRSRRSPPAGFIRPCQPKLVDHPPTGPGWLHEVKHDGYRIIARKEGGRARPRPVALPARPRPSVMARLARSTCRSRAPAQADPLRRGRPRRGRLPKLSPSRQMRPLRPLMPPRSMTTPSHKPRPVQSWPPPRTDSERPQSRAARMADCTSSAVWQ